MKKNSYITIEVDKLTNSIVNVISGDVLETEFYLVDKKEIKKKDWLFNRHNELKDENCQVYKMTIKGNENILQGLISYQVEDNFLFVRLVENAKFNRGKDKIYEGVGGNLFAFVCKQSLELGFEGFVAFIPKTSLISHYKKMLGAEKAVGQRMFISDKAARKLIDQYRGTA